jgi:autotransporter-associated beta strand protein
MMKRLEVPAIGGLLLLPCPLLAQGLPVTKTNPLPVYVQMMPWFQTPETLGGTSWGWHWTMNNDNPNTIESNGERQIASYYYPLTGPYDSSDPYIIEYQMLLMKLSGITGPIVDWYGVQGSNSDETSLKTASNDIITSTPTYGLSVGLTLEDRFSTSTSEVTANINYAASNYFTQSNFMKAPGTNTPLITLFGPITYQQPSQWTTILSGVSTVPAIVPLQYQASQVGSPATGEMGWIYEDKGTTDNLAVQQDFLEYEAGKFPDSIGDAYPGYNDYYTAGGDPSAAAGFVIPETQNGNSTLNDTLAEAQTYSKNIMGGQVATWNDYGEGTMIEPTVQNGFTSLEQIQQFTGVSYGLTQLELVYQLYQAREAYLSNSTEESQLSIASNDINNLEFTPATTIIDSALGAFTHTWDNALGPGDGMTWDTTNLNWSFGGTSPTVYADGDNVLFNDSNNGNYAVTLSATVKPASVTFNNSSGNYTLSGAGTIAGSGSLTKTGTGSLTLSTVNTYTGGTFVNGGTLIAAASGAVPTNQALSIGAAGTVQLATQTGGQTLSSLAITAGGKLDITNNSVIINYGATDPKTTILGYLASGANSGSWNGTGIISSTAAANANYGVGYSDGADGIDPNLTSGQIEIAYAQYGDITLQGEVNANDFHILAGNFGYPTSAGWEAGDFLYQGTVNAEDFHLLTENFGLTETGEDISMPSSDYAAIDAFAVANGLTVSGNVPEPTGLVSLTAIGLLARRRRRSGSLTSKIRPAR